jgi:hypothetical protein
MPLVVPLRPLPNQTLQSQLGGQACTINVYQQVYGLYMDLLIGTQPVVQGIIGLNGTLIVRSAYFGFSGDFIFLDTQGISDPVYTGLGARWQLLYLTAADIAALNLPVNVE